MPHLWVDPVRAGTTRDVQMSIASLLDVAVAVYVGVLAVLCVYGLHRYLLVYLYFRGKRRPRPPGSDLADLPHVTVQLPMYNERYVARRVIEAACAIDYPQEKLEIQVLDDSTDDTREIARATVEALRTAGHNVHYVRRADRTGYKAGALAEGTRTARGEFIAIFDADFIPPPDILRSTIHHFADPRVGMVQTRWGHVNRGLSILTQAQAILLDGHFMIEHTARNRSGRFMSFNGTAGIWRRSAIEDAGGWEHDTLTEDLDLSYRAQLRGWKFVFLPDIVSPAELPPEMNAFKAQQHRWTKGGAQTCVKLLPRVLASRENWRVKLEAFFHLTSCGVYILIVLLSLLIGPTLYMKLYYPQPDTWVDHVFDALLFFVGTCSALSFYICSQRELRRSWIDSVRYVPALMAIGVGIAFNNAIAAVEGLLGRSGEFVRTPKYGDAAIAPNAWRTRVSRQRIGRGAWQPWAELAMALYLSGCLLMCLSSPYWFERTGAALPFLCIFIAGYGYVALQTLHGHWLTRRGGTFASA